MDTVRYFIFIKFLFFKRKEEKVIFKGLILDIEPIESEVEITAGAINSPQE